MSTQRSSSNRYGNGTVSGALSRGGPSAPSPAGPFTKGYGSGLVSLGTAKKPRTASSLTERKLSVPKPVNLPSLRKENAGNDPNTQLVPSGGGGGWQKPDSGKEEAEEQAPIITAGSSWASAPSNSGVPSWQPPQPFPVAASAAARPRSLNPHEYPSLTAAASAKQSSAVKQPVPHVPSAGSQGGGNWDEDERKPIFAGAHSRLSSESWADSRPEDEDRPPSRPSWETSALNGRADWRGPSGESGTRSYSNDHWTPKLAQQRFPPRTGYTSQDRFREVEDPTLFPPPPPPRQPPPPPPPKAEQTREEVEAEKRAFEEEIDRVIEDERRRKREMQEAARLQALEAEAEERAAIEKAQASAVPPPPPPLTEEQQAAAAEVAKQKVIALRKQREEEARAAENKRKEAAQAKLKELEERIARKKAELEARSEAAAPNAESEPTAEEVLSSVEEAVGEALEASAEAALESADKATAASAIAHIVPRDPTTGHPSSVEAEAGSSISGQEALSELQGMDSMAASETAAAADGDESWSKATTPSQPTHIWQRKDKAEGMPRAGGEEDALPEQAIQPAGNKNVQQGDTGAASLFTDRSEFGPALVATSLGISKNSLAAPLQAPSQQEKPGPPLSWRAVLGGAANGEAVPPNLKLEELSVDSQSIEPGGQGRGRGRGRSRREPASREDRLETAGRGDKGRGKERGRGRGRGRNRQEAGARDDVSVASVPSGSQSFSENGLAVPPEAQSQRPPKQRGQGRGRGTKSEVDGRGRGKSNRAQNGVQPTESGAAPAASKVAQNLPPGITPSVNPPAVLPVEPSKASVDQAETVASTWPADADNQELPPISNLSLSKPPGVFIPALDPLVNIGPDARSDRAIDRPKSAAGAVARPKSSKVDSLLPNGMPVLPNDLSLDAPGPDPDKPSQPAASINFGFQPSTNSSSFSPGPFPGVYFSGQPGAHNPWQPSVPHNMQKNLSEAIHSFNNPSSSSFGQAPSQATASQPQSQGLQFGAFGAPNFPQFGQLTTDFGQSPFIRTGKEPDWSTGPINAAPGGSTGLKAPEALSGSMHGAAFPQSRGMDAVLPQGNLQKRGLQTAPGPPGLQRQTQPGPGFSNGGAAPLIPAPQQAPPGLQGPSQNPFVHFPSMAASLSQPPPSVLVDFSSGPSHVSTHMLQHGPPPGIGSRAPPLPRGLPPNLPDDVFDTADTKPQTGNANLPQLGTSNQIRRGLAEGRGRGIRGGRILPQARSGRAYGRGTHQQVGRGGPPQPPIPGPPPGNTRFQGMPVDGPGLPPQGFSQGRAAPMHPPHSHIGQYGVSAGGPGLPGQTKGRGIQSERGKARGRGDRGSQQQPKTSLDSTG